MKMSTSVVAAVVLFGTIGIASESMATYLWNDKHDDSELSDPFRISGYSRPCCSGSWGGGGLLWPDYRDTAKDSNPLEVATYLRSD